MMCWLLPCGIIRRSRRRALLVVCWVGFFGLVGILIHPGFSFLSSHDNTLEFLRRCMVEAWLANLRKIGRICELLQSALVHLYSEACYIYPIFGFWGEHSEYPLNEHHDFECPSFREVSGSAGVLTWFFLYASSHNSKSNQFTSDYSPALSSEDIPWNVPSRAASRENKELWH